MLDIMLHLTSKILFQEGREFLQDSLKRTHSRKAHSLKTTGTGDTRGNGLEVGSRRGLAGETAVAEVDQEVVVAEKVGSKQWTRNVRDPELLVENGSIFEGNQKAAAAVRMDD